MDVLSDKKPSENLLDDDGLLCKILQISTVSILRLSQSKLLSCVICSEMGFYLDCCCFFSQEFFPPDIHPKLGLYFERCGVISGPLFLDFVGSEVV